MSDGVRRINPGLLLAVLGFAGLVGSFMQTILVPIQSRLPELLDARPEDTAWAITVTLLSGAIANPIAGRLADMYGKKRVMLWLMGVLVAGSLLAAISYSVIPLIIGRALQGVGMASTPVGIAILRDNLPAAWLGSGVAIMSATLVVGGSLGMPASAVVTEFFDWHWLFWGSTLAGLLAFVLVARLVPRNGTRTGGRVDVVGAIGLSVGLVCVLLALSRGADWGWASGLTIGLLVVGFVVLLLWGWYELRVSDPMVDLRVSARLPVLMTNLASVAMGFALFTSSIAFPQLLVLPESVHGMGLTLSIAGLVLLPSGIASLLLSPAVGSLGRRFGTKMLLVSGSFVIGVAYLVAATVELTVWKILLINLISGVGVGLGYAAMPTLIMGFVDDTETGAANGLNTLMRGIGTSTGAAVIAAVLASSAVGGGGAAAPTQQGFQTAFLLGCVAAIVSGVLAMCIPGAWGSKRKPIES